jgi:short-subunit dehydrogenase
MIPNDIEKRQKLSRYADDVVTYMKEIDVLKEDIKNAGEIVKEEFDKDTLKSFKGIVRARYNSAKLQDLIESAETALAENNVLCRGN